MPCTSDYLECLELSELTYKFDASKVILANYTDNFDAIAFTGYSGALLAPMLAMALKKELILVRKSTDNCHSDLLVEGALDASRYIIVDDMIDSGDTIRRVSKMMRRFAPLAKCMGLFTYNSMNLYGVKTLCRLSKQLHEDVLDFPWDDKDILDGVRICD